MKKVLCILTCLSISSFAFAQVAAETVALQANVQVAVCNNQGCEVPALNLDPVRIELKTTPQNPTPSGDWSYVLQVGNYVVAGGVTISKVTEQNMQEYDVQALVITQRDNNEATTLSSQSLIQLKNMADLNTIFVVGQTFRVADKEYIPFIRIAAANATKTLPSTQFMTPRLFK